MTSYPLFLLLCENEEGYVLKHEAAQWCKTTMVGKVVKKNVWRLTYCLVRNSHTGDAVAIFLKHKDRLEGVSCSPALCVLSCMSLSPHNSIDCTHSTIKTLQMCERRDSGPQIHLMSISHLHSMSTSSMWCHECLYPWRHREGTTPEMNTPSDLVFQPPTASQSDQASRFQRQRFVFSVTHRQCFVFAL